MNACELTASITAAANAIACRLTDDELNLLGTVLTQLADTLFTIAAQRSISEKTGMLLFCYDLPAYSNENPQRDKSINVLMNCSIF